MRNRIHNILLEVYETLSDVGEDISFEAWYERMENEESDWITQLESEFFDELNEEQQQEFDVENPMNVEGFKSYMRDVYDKQLNRMNDVKYDGENIIIYRTIRVSQKWIDNFYRYREGTHLGIYWAHNDKYLEAYWGFKGTSNVTLEGRVSPDGVDWITSFMCNTGEGKDENELRLYRGTPIKLIDISNEDESGIPNKDIALSKMYRA